MKQLSIILFLFLSHLTIAQTAPVGSPAPKRTLVSRPNASTIESTENCTIALKIKINSDGIIYERPVLVKSHTTTSNMELINQVIDLVQKETVYSQSDKATETTMLTIKVSATEELPIIP